MTAAGVPIRFNMIIRNNFIYDKTTETNYPKCPYGFHKGTSSCSETDKYYTAVNDIDAKYVHGTM